MLGLLLICLCAIEHVTASTDPYVLYGRTAVQGQFPFTVWLSGCTGSVLDSRTILTAGHCACQARPAGILVGVVQTSNPEAGSQRYSLDVKRQVINPRYISCGTVPSRDDIAILKTTMPIVFTDVTTPLQLLDDPASVGQSVIISGYGHDETGRSGVLKYASTTVQACKQYPGAVCQSMSATSPGYDDGGSPLFSRVSGQYRQVGVFSGRDFANQQGVYASVYENLDFIRSNMG